MELKPGYKQTEVGVIPEDWKTSLLPEIAWFQEGPGLRNWQFTSTGMKVINVTNLENGVLNLDRTDRHISLSEFNRMYQHFAIDANDIVMASSGNSYSKTAIVREQDLPLVMNTSVIRFKPLLSYDYDFLWAILNAPLFKNQIDLMITGGAQPNFGPYHLKQIHVPVPPLLEQRAVATALSDMDALLAGLGRLIAKKRDLKQATMQALLNGRVRLPGFNGRWEVKRLGDHVTFLRNGVNSRADLTLDDPVKYLHYGDIHACTEVMLDPTALPSLPSSKAKALDRLRDGDLVFADASEDLIGVSKSVEISGASSIELVSGLHTIAARFDKNILADGFKAYLQFCPEFAGQLRRLAAGTKVYATNRSHIAGIEMRLPSPQEQTAIAAVLTDMDTEIAALEQRRRKTQDLKQAMMQELLTGRIRLVDNGELRMENGELKRENEK
jgi:type I restriction enzyme, S subunit